MAGEVEPVDGRFGRMSGGAEDVVRVVIGEGVDVLRGVPEGAAVGLVVQEAPGEDVGV